MQITAETALDYARARGLVADDESTRVEWLSGGVSCNVIRIHARRGAFVIKQALPQLRVKELWLSEPRRIFREVAFQRLAAAKLGRDHVPAVLDEDRENFAYAMESAPLDAQNWKSLMMDGDARPELGAQCGELLLRLQQIPLTDPRLPADFADKTFFRQLRLEPYFEFTARRQPDVADRLLALRDELEAARDCLTHADYTPKNFLVSGGRMVLLDHEVIHIGSAAFDVASIVNHLTLKMIHLPVHRERLRETARAFLAAVQPRGEWRPCLGALLLARCDGKSPAEYLTVADQQTARALARELLRGDYENYQRHWA